MILTLWVVLFLTLLAAAIASQVRGRLQAVSNFKWDMRSRAFGMRALAEVVTYFSSEVDNNYDSFHEDWADDSGKFKDIDFKGGVFSIYSERINSDAGSLDKVYGLTDEEGKININRAPANVISSLFNIAGMTSVRAGELANYIVDWRDKNASSEQGSGSEPCTMEEIPYACKNDDFEALEELWWMPGMTQAIYDSVYPELTLYGSGTINANTASSLTLQALGLSSIGAEKIVAWRVIAGNSFEDSSDIIEKGQDLGLSNEDKMQLGKIVSSGLLGTKSEFFHAKVEAEFKNIPRKIAEFIVDKTGEVKWWRQ